MCQDISWLDEGDIMSRDSFIVVATYMKSFEKLNMEQRGILITAMINYQMGKELPEMDAVTDMAFSFIKDGMDFNNAKYEEMCERNRINGKKGGRPKASGFSENPKNPHGFSENPQKPKETLYEYDYDYEYENDIDNDIEETKPKKRFTKPSVEEVRAYCQERGNTVDPERFFDFYESKGWKVGNNPMKDWKAAIRTWEKRSESSAPAPSTPTPRSPSLPEGMTQATYEKIHNFPERTIDYAALEAEVRNVRS